MSPPRRPVHDIFRPAAELSAELSEPIRRREVILKIPAYVACVSRGVSVSRLRPLKLLGKIVQHTG